MPFRGSCLGDRRGGLIWQGGSDPAIVSVYTCGGSGSDPDLTPPIWGRMTLFVYSYYDCVYVYCKNKCFYGNSFETRLTLNLPQNYGQLFYNINRIATVYPGATKTR